MAADVGLKLRCATRWGPWFSNVSFGVVCCAIKWGDDDHKTADGLALSGCEPPVDIPDRSGSAQPRNRHRIEPPPSAMTPTRPHEAYCRNVSTLARPGGDGEPPKETRSPAAVQTTPDGTGQELRGGGGQEAAQGTWRFRGQDLNGSHEQRRSRSRAGFEIGEARPHMMGATAYPISPQQRRRAQQFARPQATSNPRSATTPATPSPAPQDVRRSPLACTRAQPYTSPTIERLCGP